MQILNLINNHHVKFSHTLSYRLLFDEEAVTIIDQEEACIDPRNAYYFAALNIPGTDVAKCQTVACYDSLSAYFFAKNVRDADIMLCKNLCYKSIYWKKELNKILYLNAITKNNRKTSD